MYTHRYVLRAVIEFTNSFLSCLRQRREEMVYY